jgi:hypothetical protein
MKRIVNTVVTAIAAAGMAAAAHAQTGIYGMLSYSHVTGQGVGYNVTSSQHGSISPVGGTFGVYTDFAHLGPVDIGGDGRFFIQNSGGNQPYGSKASGALFGPRIDINGLHLPLRPYAQLELGVVGANNGNSYSKSTGLAYQFQVGADYGILPLLDVRLEYGAGQIAGGTGPSRGLQSLGGGLALHF